MRRKAALLLPFLLCMALAACAAHPAMQPQTQTLQQSTALPTVRSSAASRATQGRSATVTVPPTETRTEMPIKTTLFATKPQISSTATQPLPPETTKTAPRAYAVVSQSVCPIYREPDSASMLDTQALLNQRLQILGRSGAFYRVRVPDGYTGYAPISALGEAAPDAQAGEILLTVKKTVAPLTDENGTVLLQAPMGAQFHAKQPQQGYFTVQLPGGKSARLARADVQTGTLRFQGGENIVESAKLFLGTPYLWGGVSAKGIDCSGLTYLCYRMNGLTLPRDSRPQFQEGQEVALAEAQPGDLLFFAAEKGGMQVTHTGIFMGKEQFIHSSISGKGVAVSNLSDFGYREKLVSVRRYITP